MNECIEVMEPVIEIQFKSWKEKQKELIDFILQISNLNLSQLAEVIETNIETLNSVIQEGSFLPKKPAINLNQLIYMFSSSCSSELEH
jgi:hypothetical protein